MIKLKLKELREQEKLTQQEFAERFNIPRQNYARWELNKNQPTLEMLCKIADYYGVSLDYLCEHTPKNKVDLGYIDEKCLAILKLVQELTDKNKEQIFYYASGLLAGQ